MASRKAPPIAKPAPPPVPKPSPPITRPSQLAAKPLSRVTKPSPQATKPSSPVTKPSPQATKPSSPVTKPSPQATKPSSPVTKRSPQATKPAPPPKPSPPLARSSPPVTTKTALPVTKQPEPVTKQPEPVTTKTAQPVTKQPEPVTTKTAQPVTKQPEPVTTKTAQPVTKQPEPVTKETAQPVTKQPEPVTKETAQPVTKQPEPVTKETAQPVTKQPEPVTKETAQPVTKQPEPVTKETEPKETVQSVTRKAVVARGAFKRAPTMVGLRLPNAESLRLREDKVRTKNWKRWGPYLSERQWATVREDYSPDGSCWDYFTHDHARSRAYRWGEDGLMGICDRQCRLCFSVALWNEKDPILKERIFGLTGSEGNHGEDPKECYYYLDSTPTHSYMKALYKYPQSEYPYAKLVEENRSRGFDQLEFELEDTGVFDEGKYWDVFTEYAKGGPSDILIKITVCNRGPETAKLHLLPTLWYRNTWIWGCTHEGCTRKPVMKQVDENHVQGSHETLGKNHFYVGPDPDGKQPPLLWTENETNSMMLHGIESYTEYFKDAFHRYLIKGEEDAINPNKRGTKVSPYYLLEVPPGEERSVQMRLTDVESMPEGDPFGPEFEEVFHDRKEEADDFYDRIMPEGLGPQQKMISRQAYAGLLWTKQFYHYIIESWLGGDPDQPPPPEERKTGRNALEWKHLFNRDVISMPDKWEYPWYASWDLAFHMIPFAKVDPEFAKHQLTLFLREWYMAPNGQIPAYEFALSDVNPPVHAWAIWRVFKMTAPRPERDIKFLASSFMKLILNFNWWINRKDPFGRNIFSGGFLGLDNIGIFDRSRPLPTGGVLEQADGTAWVAFFCVVMLDIALELALHDDIYEDMASKFFEHFVFIVDAMNQLGGGEGLWNEEDGFYYDHLRLPGYSHPMRVRSMVGLIPLFASLVLEDEVIQKLPNFRKRLTWFLENRKDLAKQISYLDTLKEGEFCHLLAIPTKDKLLSVLRYMLDEDEFLSPFGIRSLSKVHKDLPFSMNVGGEQHCVSYVPGESNTYVFGGNSNWRGPVWLCVNFLIIECLERYFYFYGDDLKVECPTGSGKEMNLLQVSHELCQRVSSIFLPDETGRRPCHGDDPHYSSDPAWKDLVLFYEYFHGDTGRGCGASHQTGWTALIARCFDKIATCPTFVKQ